MPDLSATVASAASTLLLAAGTVALVKIGEWLASDSDRKSHHKEDIDHA